MGTNIFENAKYTNEQGQEFWSARQMAKILEYSEYRHFQPVIERAKEACKNSGQVVSDHFEDILAMVALGSGSKREVQDVQLTRYACYLIVQNGDPSKPVIAAGQTYFAVQTRRQELADMEVFNRLNEDKQRLFLRQQIKEHNTALADAAKGAGVEHPREYAIFQNSGYQGLYGGLTQVAIHRKKGLKKSQKILDHMNSSELAANLFRATQTEEKLRRENIQGKKAANLAHFQVGAKVRKTIEELGGIMPEDQPTPEKSIKQLENEQKKLEKKK